MTIACLGAAELRPAGGTLGVATRLDRYRYVAPADVGPLHEFDQYTANVYTPADGRRRFVPREEDGLTGYVERAFQIGHSLLARDRRWSKATFDDYLVGKLAVDWIGHVRERLGPRRVTVEDLIVPGGLRRSLGRADALPDELAEDVVERRGPEMVNKIAAAGARSALRRGLVNPSETETIALGLMEAAAEQPPPAAAPEQIAVFIRDALFDLSDETDVLSTAVQEEVDARFEDAVRSRLYIPRRDFTAWLYGSGAYMLQTVERAADRGVLGADDRRAVVRRAMCRLAWRGLAQVSDCLDAFARAFERALPRRLDDAERRLFHAMYRRQPYLGNFVLPLLLDAKDLVQQAVLDVWESPDDAQAVNVLQWMLLYRGQIIPRIREMQRIARVRGCPSFVSTNNQSRKSPKESLWDKLTGQILEQYDIQCPHCEASPFCKLADSHAEPGCALIDVYCHAHGTIRQIIVGHHELVAARQTLFNDLDPPEKWPSGVDVDDESN